MNLWPSYPVVSGSIDNGGFRLTRGLGVFGYRRIHWPFRGTLIADPQTGGTWIEGEMAMPWFALIGPILGAATLLTIAVLETIYGRSGVGLAHGHGTDPRLIVALAPVIAAISFLRDKWFSKWDEKTILEFLQTTLQAAIVKTQP